MTTGELYSNYHKTQPIMIHNKKIQVDEKLVPIITELNKLGIRTTECCQGGTHHSSDTIWINPYITIDLTGISFKVESNHLTINWELEENV